MALIVEDGSGKADANSYISVADARTFASSRGITMDASDTIVEQQLLDAMDWLAQFYDRWQGLQVTRLQALPWPRSYVWLNGYMQNANFMPPQLLHAQVFLAVESETTELLPNGAGREVIRKKTDVLETEWAPTGTSVVTPVFSRVDTLLAPLLDGGGGMSSLRVGRG